MRSRLRIVVFYNLKVAPDHGSRRILEQMAWLVKEGCSVALAPVVTDGAPPAEASTSVAAYGIDILDPVLVRAHSPAARAWFGLTEHLCDPGGVERVVRDADWIVQGNACLVGLTESLRAAGRPSVVSWDGDAASRWHATYVRWLLRRDPLRAARRSVFVASARRAEHYLLRHCDFATVPGPADLAALSRFPHNGTPLFLVPNVVRLDQGADADAVAQSPHDILFVGSAYGPNVDGLRWFLDRVWPSVGRDRPGTRLIVAGHNLREDVVYKSSVPRSDVVFTGKIQNLAPLYRSARVVIVPIFYGSGVPNKFLEAVASDVGIVATTYVIEAVGSPRGLRGTDRADAWAAAVIDALDDPRSSRVESAVRAQILATHGPAGFDRAMGAVIGHVRRLRYA